MSNGLKSQQGPQTTDMKDLLEFLKTMQSFGGKEEEKTNKIYQTVMNDIGSNILSSFDDVTYTSNLNNLEEYYNRNLDNLDESSIELYSYLKEKSKTHQEKYTTFDGAFDVLDASGRSLNELFTRYNDADFSDKEVIKDELIICMGAGSISSWIKSISKNEYFRKS